MSAKYGTKLSHEVLEVLSGMTFNGSIGRLPSGELPRPLYLAVNKALEVLGGKWNRSAKGHVFAEIADPVVLIDAAITAGEVVDLRKVAQQFFTPDPLAERLVTLCNIKPGNLVLEPNAGHGALALPAKAALQGIGGVACVEKDPTCCEVLRKKGFTVKEGDFLAISHQWQRSNDTYDRIIMNPPFNNRQDARHVLAAWELLAKDGRLVSVVSAGAAFRQETEYVYLRELVVQGGRLTPLPDGSFKSSGTNVSTMVLELNGEEYEA